MVLKAGISKITAFWAVYLIISPIFMRQVLNSILKIIGRPGVSIMLWVIFLTGLILAFLYFYRSRPTKGRILLFLVISAVWLFYASTMKITDERIHLINFGLLGWLFMRDIGKFKKGFKEIGLSLILCVLVAIIEETYQRWIPGRVSDIRDVLFAAIGSISGISLFLLK